MTIHFDKTSMCRYQLSINFMYRFKYRRPRKSINKTQLRNCMPNIFPLFVPKIQQNSLKMANVGIQQIVFIMIEPRKIFKQVSLVIRNSLSQNSTCYFPNKQKLIEAFEYYVYFRYAGRIVIGSATQTFLKQIDSSVRDLSQLSKEQLKEMILVLFSIIQSFARIEEIRGQNLNSVQLRFQQLAILQSRAKESLRKQNNKDYAQEQAKQSKQDTYFINEEGLLKLMFQKGIQKEIKNNSSLITPQMTFNFIEIQEDRNSLVLGNKTGLY